MPDSQSRVTLSPARQTVGLIVSFVVCFLAGFLGSMASIRQSTFYGQLTQPDWAPPAWLFGPAWTTLFILMAIAAWLVWRRGGFAAHAKSLTLFVTQLVFNALWSWLFFAWQMGGPALVDIGILWLLIAGCIVAFWQTSKPAGLMLVPYLAWVSFAGVLNYSLWQLNPQALGG